jgi:hypothetical protein
VNSPDGAERGPKKEEGWLGIVEVDEFRNHFPDVVEEGFLHEVSDKVRRSQRDTQHANFVHGGDRDRASPGERTWLGFTIQPGPFALGGIKVQTNDGTFRQQDIPDLLKGGGVRDDTPVIHVPFMVGGVQFSYVLDYWGQSTAKEEGTEGVTLLHSWEGPDDVFVGVEKGGFCTIAPIHPRWDTWESRQTFAEESFTTDKVKGVLEVNFEKGQTFPSRRSKGISEWVGHDLDTPWASNTEILSFERQGDFFFGPETKTFRHQPTNGVPATQGPDRTIGFQEGNRHPSGKPRTEKIRSLTGSQVVDHVSECPKKSKTLDFHTLLEKERSVAEETRAWPRTKGRKG